MKQYRCHKLVHAAQILEMLPYADPPELVLAGSPPEVVNDSWVERHKPEVGGYFVRYANGYESYSPQEAFEEGYTLLVEDEQTELTVDDLNVKIERLERAFHRFNAALTAFSKAQTGLIEVIRRLEVTNREV